MLAHISGNADVTAGTAVRVHAIDDTTLLNVGGTLASSTGKSKGNSAIGAAVSLNRVENEVKAWIDGATTEVTAPVVEVHADSNVEVEVYTVGGANADAFSFAGSVSVNWALSTTEAGIDGAEVTATTSVRVEASDDSSFFAVAGSGARSSNTTAVGAAFSKNSFDNTIRAFITGAAVNAPTVDVVAGTTASIQAIAVGGSLGDKNALAGSVTLNEISSRIEASISSSTVTASTAVKVSAQDDSSIMAIGGSGALSGKGNAVGAAFSKNDVVNTIRSSISGSVFVTPTVEVEAGSSAEILAIAVGGAFADKNALGASVTLNRIANLIEASGTGTIAAGSSIRIEANDNTSIDSWSGGV
ncbi:MAG: hypothetical protein ACREI7_10380, partial [Myxococcota bacterium]